MLGGPYDGTVYMMDSSATPVYAGLPLTWEQFYNDDIVLADNSIKLYPQRTVHGWRFIWPKGY